MKQKSAYCYLNKKCRDIVTGYTGVCIGINECLFGCTVLYVVNIDNENPVEMNKSKPLLVTRAEVISDDLVLNIEMPTYTEPKYFGDYCEDKMTGFKGNCIGRYFWLFNTDQYELIAKYDPSRIHGSPEDFIIIDEGRVRVLETYNDAENTPKKDAVSPEEVMSPRKGGLFNNSIHEHGLSLNI